MAVSSSRAEPRPRRRLRRAGALAALLAALAAFEGVAGAETKHACIAAADTAQKVRDEGRYRRAVEMFAVCARPECPLVVAASCARWQAETEAATPTFVATARDENGERVADVRLSLDGERVELLREGVAAAVDPGAHVFRFERDGRVTVDVRVVLRPGEKGRGITAVLRPAPMGSALSASLDAPVIDRASAVAPSSFFTPRVVTTMALTTASLLAAGGAVLFDSASRRERDTAATFRAQNRSDACAQSSSQMCASWSLAVDAQNRDAALSRGLFVGAGALAVSAIVTWLVWPRAEAPKPPLAASARLTPWASRELVGAYAVGTF